MKTFYVITLCVYIKEIITHHEYKYKDKKDNYFPINFYINSLSSSFYIHIEHSEIITLDKNCEG